jgi:hypothetical protein
MGLTEAQMEQIEMEIKKKELEAATTQAKFQQLDLDNRQSDQNIAEEQLDTSKDLLNFYYQLNGYTLQPNSSGTDLVWQKDKDCDLSILSKAGINYCFWMVQGYLTKNTLLSNYEDDVINEKMEDIATTIADTLFMKYDTYFNKPTFNDCKEELKRRIEQKINRKKLAFEIINIKIDEDKIRSEVITEIEDRIDKELLQIKEQFTKDRLKMFESLVRLIQDTIHSAYLRAWKGQERRTLREHIHISETKGGMPIIPQQKTVIDRLRGR